MGEGQEGKERQEAKEYEEGFRDGEERDALGLVALRGRLMDEAEPGAMVGVPPAARRQNGMPVMDRALPSTSCRAASF